MRVGVLTGGGDCPGLNAVIRAVVRKGVQEYVDIDARRAKAELAAARGQQAGDANQGEADQQGDNGTI